MAVGCGLARTKPLPVKRRFRIFGLRIAAFSRSRAYGDDAILCKLPPNEMDAANHQRLTSIDQGRRLAAYCVGKTRTGQRRCWPLNAGPLDPRRGRALLELLGTFETVAQIAIALTGFTGVVVALGRRELGWSPTDKFLLQALVYWSLGTTFLAFVPAGLSGFPPDTAWRLAHFTFVIFHATVFAWYFHQARRHAFPVSTVGHFTVVVGLGILLAEASVVAGLVLRAAPYLYLLALLWFLYLAATMFIAMVFRQLWDE